MASKRQHKENNLKLKYEAHWNWRKEKQTKRFRNSLMFHQTLFLPGNRIKIKSFTLFVKEIWQKG